MRVRRCESVHLGGLKDYTDTVAVWHVGSFAQKREEQVADVEMSQPIDLEVSVDLVVYARVS